MSKPATGSSPRAVAPVRGRRRYAGSAAKTAPSLLLALLILVALAPGAALASKRPFIGGFSTISQIGSTVPANGDVNPYGIVNVQKSVGALVKGDILISNFNNFENLQGTGSTIVQMTPSGSLSVFAQINPATLPGPCPGGVGLTTALAILPRGFVVVGSLPTSDGMSATAQAGCLIVLNSNGQPVETISGPPINGPWDMTSDGEGANVTLYVTNVLDGTVQSGETPIDEGTVVRIGLRLDNRQPPAVKTESVIATGFPERTDPAALVVGPTGVALGKDGTLYVADTQDSRIAAVPNAANRQTPLGGGGTTVAQGGFLKGPLGLTLAPSGDILTANAGDGNIVETTPTGAQFQPVDTGAGGGGLFGLVAAPQRQGVYFVNDTENTLDLLH
jgi:hypothetical protein